MPEKQAETNNSNDHPKEQCPFSTQQRPIEEKHEQEANKVQEQAFQTPEKPMMQGLSPQKPALIQKEEPKENKSAAKEVESHTIADQAADALEFLSQTPSKSVKAEKHIEKSNEKPLEKVHEKTHDKIHEKLHEKTVGKSPEKPIEKVHDMAIEKSHEKSPEKSIEKSHDKSFEKSHEKSHEKEHKEEKASAKKSAKKETSPITPRSSSGRKEKKIDREELEKYSNLIGKKTKRESSSKKKN